MAKTKTTDYRGMRHFPVYANRKNLREAGESLKKYIDDAISFVEQDLLRKTDEWEDFLCTLAMLCHPYEEDPNGLPNWDVLDELFSLLIRRARLYEAYEHGDLKQDIDDWLMNDEAHQKWCKEEYIPQMLWRILGEQYEIQKQIKEVANGISK